MSALTTKSQQILNQINLLMEEYSKNPSLITIDILQEKTRSFYEALYQIKHNSESGIEVHLEDVKTRVQEEPKNVHQATKVEEEVSPKIVATQKEEPKNEEIEKPVKKEVETKPIQEERPKEAVEPEKPVVEKKEVVAPKKEPKTEQAQKQAEPEKSQESEVPESKTVSPEIEPKQTIETPKKKQVKEPQSTKDTNLNLGENKETIADTFTPKESMNDLLSRIAKNTDLATQLQNRPVKDLKNAISLNDKIWFIRELFSGDADTYNAIIEKINNADSLESGIQIIEAFSWDKEQDSTKQFLELIYRKFVQ